MSTTGADGNSCTATAPCKTLARAYNVAVAGDVVQLAPGTYPRQDVPAGSKAVAFKGGTGVVLRQLFTDADNATFDGINLDASGVHTNGAVF